MFVIGGDGPRAEFTDQAMDAGSRGRLEALTELTRVLAYPRHVSR